jgi:glucokinase
MTGAETALLGDIGATNARFAFLAGGILGPVKWIEVSRYAHLADAIWEFLKGKRMATSALFAVAAPGGVYIAGGIAPRIVDYLAASEFRRRFEQKGRLQRYLKAIPSQVIMHPAATFLGLKSLSASAGFFV